MSEKRFPALEAAKQLQGWSWVWLAWQTRYSVNMVHAVRSGRRPASAAFRAKVAALLGTTEEALFCPEEVGIVPTDSR